jgi:hypothetical protein
MFVQQTAFGDECCRDQYAAMDLDSWPRAVGRARAEADLRRSHRKNFAATSAHTPPPNLIE